MNVIKQDVIEAMHKECESAEKRFPMFASDHESYAVIKEELEETEDDLDTLKTMLGGIWINIKRNYNEANEIGLIGMRDEAIECAIEAIQTASMCQKALDSREARENKK